MRFWQLKQNIKNEMERNVEYIIGIDSGGTNYRVQAESLNGEILGRYVGTTANHYSFGEEEVKKRINHHIDECLGSFGGQRADCRYLVCGTTGLDTEEDDIFLNHLYGNLEGFDCPAVVMNDAEIAHYTVTGGQGVLVISGTGSIAFGRNQKGESGRVGGWSLSIMGEEGSGTWVTRKALRYLADCYDKVAEEGLLADLIRKKLDIYTVKDLTDYSAYLIAHKNGKVSLGETVDYAAEHGDENAVKILKAAAGETFKLVDNLIRVLNMQDDPEIAVGIWGSNIVQSRTHKEEFERLVKNKYPQAVVKKPMQEAVDGAARMARELYGTIRYESD